MAHWLEGISIEGNMLENESSFLWCSVKFVGSLELGQAATLLLDISFGFFLEIIKFNSV